MASRRTRIKGIANIPQRKKPIVTDTSVTDEKPEENPKVSEELTKEPQKFLKPINDAIKRRPSVSQSPQLLETTTSTTPQEKRVVVLSDMVVPNFSPVACNLSNLTSDASDTESVTDQFPQSSSVIFSKKLLSESDSDYPAPPISPSKFNRSRIKAVPRLGFRKPGGASESEDEGRKYGRIRNNSVCSVASTIYPEPSTPTMSVDSPKEVKKLFRTEQSHKLAEARREFNKRFGSTNPDKQKLKMIDLIFYNPVTNPMTQKPIIQKQPEEEEQPVAEVEDEVIPEDDPMPVPQIKIGPSGEIILDEQSLVIENSEVKRQKERIKKSRLINGDISASYGVYKRVPRASAWSQKETLRFYKALNLIGTDFSGMTPLFPKRSRRELKMKFKKEERVNRILIDRAITQPSKYNFADLKREMQMEEEEEEFIKRLKEEEKQKEKLDKKERPKRKRKNSELALPIKKRPQPSKHLNILSVLDEDDYADVSQSDTDDDDDDDDDECLAALKPTRSGRIPKSTQKTSNSSVGTQLDLIRSQRVFDSTNNAENLLPGAVVVATKDDDEGTQGGSKYEVFMVTPQRQLTPLELESDVVEQLVNDGNITKLN